MDKIVPKTDKVLNDSYGDLMEYLDWPPVIERAGVYRFKGKAVPLEIQAFTYFKIFNHLAYCWRVGRISLQEWMQFYIDTECSLSSFLDVFARRIWPEDEEDEE